MEIYNNLLFRGISKEKIKEITVGINYVVNIYKKGEVIENEDNKCYYLGLILEGNVELQRIFTNGKYYTLKKFKAGDVFGEALVFVNDSTYPATVISSSKSKVLFINKDEIIKLCLKEEKILENFISLLSSKVIILNDKIKYLSFKSVREKVANYILEESKGKNEVILNDTKEEVAAYLGMPRPSFSRELNNLKREGLIDYSRKNIVIINRELLEEILEI